VILKVTVNTICEFKISLGDCGKNFQLISDSVQAMKECYGNVKEKFVNISSRVQRLGRIFEDEDDRITTIGQMRKMAEDVRTML
jgi:phage-related protein